MKAQSCRGHLILNKQGSHTTRDYTTVHHADGRRFHFCRDADCQAEAEAHRAAIVDRVVVLDVVSSYRMRVRVYGAPDWPTRALLLRDALVAVGARIGRPITAEEVRAIGTEVDAHRAAEASS